MQSVIVTVKLSGIEREYDLEVPVDVPAQELAELITHNINPSSDTTQTFRMHCIRPQSNRKRLRDDESLSEAGLWDGVYLEIEPVDAVASENWQDIVIGWVSLDDGEAGIEKISGGWVNLDQEVGVGEGESDGDLEPDTNRTDDSEAPDDSPSPGDGYVWKPL